MNSIFLSSGYPAIVIGVRVIFVNCLFYLFATGTVLVHLPDMLTELVIGGVKSEIYES